MFKAIIKKCTKQVFFCKAKKYLPIIVAECQPVQTFKLVITQRVVVLVNHGVSNLLPVLGIWTLLVLCHITPIHNSS